MATMQTTNNLSSTGQYISDGTNNSSLSISTGNVGIGTTNPGGPLGIKKDPPGGTPWLAQLYIEPANDAKEAGISFKTTRSASDRVWSIFAGTGGATENTNLRIYDSTAGADRVNIDSTGKVGIGTTGPGSDFHLYNAGTGLSAKLEVSSGIYPRLKLEGGDAIINRSETSNLYFGEDADSGYFLFRGSGKVGIGTANPQSKLHVSGGIQIGDDPDAAGASKVGALKYFKSGNNTYLQVCVQTGASAYSWETILSKSW